MQKFDTKFFTNKGMKKKLTQCLKIIENCCQQFCRKFDGFF